MPVYRGAFLKRRSSNGTGGGKAAWRGPDRKASAGHIHVPGGSRQRDFAGDCLKFFRKRKASGAPATAVKTAGNVRLIPTAMCAIWQT